jgi:hypothetical protein
MKRPIAYLLIRSLPHYRRDAFKSGFKRLGYNVLTSAPPSKPGDRDILIIWNRYGVMDTYAKRFNTVIVVENGYIPMRDTRKTFSIALDYHNGAGRWYVGDVPRLHLLDIDIKPWKVTDGGDVVLLPQRGVGVPGVAMPGQWVYDVKKRLQAVGVPPESIYTRPHPGNVVDPRRVVPIELDMRRAGVAVTWASGAGLRALIEGVPVVHEFDRWIGADAASFGLREVHLPLMPDRAAMLERVAWAQWSVEEVQSGLPFEGLLNENRYLHTTWRRKNEQNREGDA